MAIRLTKSGALAAIGRALDDDRVVFTSHARAALADEGCDQLFAIDEILVAWRDNEVQRDRRHAGRWVAFGPRLAVVLEIDDDLCVVTVFDHLG